jgi:hypothetical protein
MEGGKMRAALALTTFLADRNSKGSFEYGYYDQSPGELRLERP